MPNFLKVIIYSILFIFSFVFFLYWTFPYDTLKDRLINTAETQLGPEYDVMVSSFSPSFFTGAVLKQVKIVKRSGDDAKTVWEAQRVKVRASLGSLFFGKTNVSFSLKNQKSSASGSLKLTDDGWNFHADFSNLNLGDFGFLSPSGTSKLVSSIDGEIKLNINNKQLVQSTGSVELKLEDMKFTAGELKIAEGVDFTVPELLFAKDGVLNIELSKGAIKVKEFKTKEADLKLDIAGDIFLSSILKNYRMNLKGTFAVTPKLEQAIPILFMIEKQRSTDGTYPLNITGRISQPSIKVGDFTLPL